MNLNFYQGLPAGFILGYITYCVLMKFSKSSKGTSYFKFVMVLRTDIDLQKRKAAEHCSQAALACYKKALQITPEYVKNWEANSQPKIALKLDNNSNESLLNLKKKADDLGIVSVAVKETDQKKNEVYTVLGIGPAPEYLIDRVTGHLKLL